MISTNEASNWLHIGILRRNAEVAPEFAAESLRSAWKFQQRQGFARIILGLAAATEPVLLSELSTDSYVPRTSSTILTPI